MSQTNVASSGFVAVNVIGPDNSQTVRSVPASIVGLGFTFKSNSIEVPVQVASIGVTIMVEDV